MQSVSAQFAVHVAPFPLAFHWLHHVLYGQRLDGYGLILARKLGGGLVVEVLALVGAVLMESGQPVLCLQPPLAALLAASQLALQVLVVARGMAAPDAVGEVYLLAVAQRGKGFQSEVNAYHFGCPLLRLPFCCFCHEYQIEPPLARLFDGDGRRLVLHLPIEVAAHAAYISYAHFLLLIVDIYFFGTDGVRHHVIRLFQARLVGPVLKVFLIGMVKVT